MTSPPSHHSLLPFFPVTVDLGTVEDSEDAFGS